MAGIKNYSVTPQLAAFFVATTLLSACQDSTDLAQLPATTCDSVLVSIEQVQGEGETSPVLHERVTLAGIVTHIESQQGLYIEEATAAPSGRASKALYLQSRQLSTVASEGDRIAVSGLVSELGEDNDTITSLTGISAHRICGSHQVIPSTGISLPWTGAGKEALEAMHIHLDQSLVVTDAWRFENGDLTLSLDEILPAPTEVARPGSEARQQAARNRAASVRIRLHENDRQLMAAGTRVLSASGVLGHDGRGLRLLLTEPLNIVPRSVYKTAPPFENDIRIIGLNLHNYFNGDGEGGGFPTPRGAENPAQFTRQRARLAATIEHLQPHMVAVMELENDGFGPHSAARDFIEDLEAASGHVWQAIDAWGGPLGGDAITVGIFYRPDRLEPAGDAATLTGPEFDRLSRVPLAQAFSDPLSGESFLVVVNHLKSKGSCPDDGRNANLRDGQGCWNLARTQAAGVMARWTRALSDQFTGGNALILGDMNAYRLEDPVTAILDTGFKDLTAPSALRPHFSHIYAGQAGTLDYAFSSANLRPNVSTAMILNFNSPYPRGMELPLPWLGASDHDPVLVDLRFRQASTSD